MIRHSFEDQPLAVVGMACRLPGANNLEEYWNLIRTGASGFGELPPHRLDQELYYFPEKGVLGKSYTRLGGVVETPEFDRQACPVAEEIISACDSSHVTMLDVAASAIRHAGYDPLAIPLRNTGVYVGHARGSPLVGDLAYATHAEEVIQHLRGIAAFDALSADRRNAIIAQVVEKIHSSKPRRLEGGGPDVVCSGVAGIVSRAFGLTGPYMAVDAACASSFVALGMAAAALHHGRIDMALVGGASYSSWFSNVLFSQAHALSATGSCPFDARADGFIGSDGYVAVLVKTLPRALADGNRVYGVVRGVGMSSDGRGKSLWAPRKEGQIEAIRRAYHPGLDPSRVQYVEAHGTSTQVGDATELEALTLAIGQQLPPGSRVPVASAKANVGHTRETAGLTGLVKTLLAMQHQVIPAATNFVTPNPEIPWDQSPFFVPREEIPWPVRNDGQPRRAVVDAFGIGGLNVHVVVEDLCSENASGAFAPAASGENVAKAQGNGRPASSAGEDDSNAIAVIGLGGVFPGARTIAALWELLGSGRDPKSEVPASRWNADLFHTPGTAGPYRSPTRLGGFITDFAYDWKTHRIPPRQLETSDPLKYMLLDAADQALKSAGYDQKTFDRRRASVIVGTTFGGDFANQLNTALRLPEFQRTLRAVLREQGISEEAIGPISESFGERILRNYPAIHDETGSYTSSTLASQLAKTLDLMGGAFAIDSDCASSLAAVGAGVDLLLANACDMVLCFGGQRYMDITVYEQYAARGMLAAGAPRAGFDATADGCVPGEGVGAVLLKRLSDARRDKDNIQVVIRGYGAGLGAESISSGMRLAVVRALESSGILPGDVKLVAAAGTGIPRVDAEESRALAETYGAAQRKQPLLVGSVASQLGYSLGAAGMASLLKTTLALVHGQVPASVGFAQPSEAMAAQANVLRPVAEAIPLRQSPDEALGVAGVSDITQRGLAYHVLLQRPEAICAESQDQTGDWRIVRLGGASTEDLLARALRSRDDGAELFSRAAAMEFHPADRIRLAMVADSPETLAKKLQLLSAQTTTTTESRLALMDQGVFLQHANGQPRVAFLFSGQGSQYAGMLRELIRENPAAARMTAEIDATMARLGHPSFAEIAWEGGENLGHDVWRTQVSVLLADLIVHAALTDAGLRPDVVVGHSYGEYPALVVAGVWTLEQAIRVTQARAAAMDGCQIDGGMLVTATTPEVIERIAAGVKDVWVANHNAPDQTVVAGIRERLAELESRLSAEGIENQWIPVPRPFHSPLMQPAQAALAEALAIERLLPPRIPLLSSVTNRYVADPGDIRNNLVEQLTAPVRYVDLINRLVNDGVTALVEVGPRQVLTRLHRRILGSRDLTVVASDQPKRPGVAQLRQVQAALECAGVSVGVASQNGHLKPGALAPKIGPNATDGEIIHFDATARRREKMRRAAEEAVSPAATSEAAAKAPADEMEKFLINFVCEQTGYPPEIVELDADMEADLGLDSIKKAQLFGELREHFSIQPVGKLTLEDFPTLRHVLNFLREHAVAAPSAPASPAAVPAARLAESSAAGVGAVKTAKLTEAAPRVETSDDPPVMLNVVHLTGTPYEIGREHARTQSDAIRLILNRYADLMGSRIAEVRELYGALSEPELLLDASACEELRGLADGLGVPSDYLLAYNIGLDPLAAPGCSQFAIAARANAADGLLHATNEDWVLALALPNCLKRMVQVRYPAGAIPHVIFSAAGQLGGINGVNAHGLGVSSTLLLDRPRRDNSAKGKMHSVVVRTVLERATDIASAVEIVRSIDKMWAWSLCLSHHATDQLCYLEYDGAEVLVETDKDSVLSTNHCRLQPPTTQVPDHSRHRFNRLEQLLGDGGKRSITLDRLKEALRDRFDLGRQRITTHLTMNTVQRTDNQSSIIMRPAQNEVWVTPGPLSEGAVDRYFRLDVGALLAKGHEKLSDGNRASGTISSPVPEDDEPSPDAADNVSQRFVLRMVDAPLESADRPLLLDKPAIVLGENPTAAELRRRLTENGVAVLDLPVGDLDQALASLESHWQSQPASHLFLVTARDEEPAAISGTAGFSRRDHGIMLPYLICQKWLMLVASAKLLEGATLVAVTGLGGDFGLSGRGSAPQGGGLAGLLKAIRHEQPKLRVKVIDAPQEDPPALVAASVCRELAAPGPETEVAFVRGKRRTIRAALRTARKKPGHVIPRGGTWVVTGGATGITARVARELARRYELRLHLLGRSPVPRVDPAWHSLSVADLKQLKMSTAMEARQAGKDPTTAWRNIERTIEMDQNLRAFAEAGVHATYHRCDVSDEAALERVLAKIREASGSIQGILHGAGVESAARFERKTREGVLATLAGKVGGAAALMALTKEDPLAFFVAFGSVSGRFGVEGQTDYSLASDLLAKLVNRFRQERPSCAAVTFHWPGWDEIGMAVRPETKVVLQSAGVRLLPPTEGIEHLIAELEAGAPESEVVILSPPAQFDRDRIIPRRSTRQAYAEREELIARSPMIDGIYELRLGESLSAEARLDPTADLFLRDHQLQGSPILPAVIGMEMFAEAATILLPGQTVTGLADVEFLSGFRFYSDKPQSAVILATRTERGIACELRADFYNREGRLTDPHRLYMRGLVEMSDRPADISAPPPPLAKDWHKMEYLDLARATERGRLYIGPTFQYLREVSLEPTGCWGRIEAPPHLEIAGSRPGDEWIIPSIGLDTTFQAAGAMLYFAFKTLQLPRRLGRLRLGRPPRPGEQCVVRHEMRDRSQEHAQFDLVLCGEDNSVILAVDGFRFVIVPQKTTLA